MTRDRLLALLTRHGIQHRPGIGDEVGVQCPRCGPLHTNRRITLYVNTRNGKYICYRCEPRNAGREWKYFLRLFSLENEDRPDPPTDDQDARWHRRYGTAPTEDPPRIPLPDGFRRDWDATVTGRTVLKYLKGRLSTGAIKRSGVGYTVKDGYAVFPVRLNGELLFWQARRVLYGGSGPKYYTPPEAQKSHVLYGLDWLTDNCAIIVEGIFDALCTEHGVALLGKSISEHQLALLQRRRVTTVTVMLDGDATAAARAVARQLRWLPGCAVTVATLQPGDDPATSNIVARFSRRHA